jgi:hypothetical protein
MNLQAELNRIFLYALCLYPEKSESYLVKREECEITNYYMKYS